MVTPTLNTIIIDDEPGAAADLAQLVRSLPGVALQAVINDPAKAVETVGELAPDAIFLDIQMPGKNGLEIARELHEAGDPPAIIFVTAFDSYAISAIRHAAFDFLVKPVDPGELREAIDRLIKQPRRSGPDDRIARLLERTLLRPRIKISTAGGFTLINPADVIYIRADWNYSEFFLGDGKSELATQNIGSVEDLLPPNEFHRISRSVIINAGYLTKVSRKKREALLVKDGKEYRFPIPLLNIRKLEKFLEGS